MLQAVLEVQSSVAEANYTELAGRAGRMVALPMHVENHSPMSSTPGMACWKPVGNISTFRSECSPKPRTIKGCPYSIYPLILPASGPPFMSFNKHKISLSVVLRSARKLVSALETLASNSDLTSAQSYNFPVPGKSKPWELHLASVQVCVCAYTCAYIVYIYTYTYIQICTHVLVR